MKICNPTCADELPSNDWTKVCNLSTRDGGIPFLTFFKCDNDLEFPFPPVGADPNASPWNNIDNVLWAICNGHLFITGELLGQKPKGSFTKRRLSSCGPEKTISGTKTLTFQDFNADIDNLIDFDFWDAVVNNAQFLNFGYITCDGRWYQFDGDWDIELDEVIEDTKDGKSFYDGVISMSTKDLLKPIITNGLLNAIRNFKISEDCGAYS